MFFKAAAPTEIYALGATLYEMATARKAFSGKSQASLISSIMTSEPPSITTVSPMLPPGLERVVRACLAKEPDERIQTAHDVKLQLQWIRDAGSQAGVPAPIAERRKNRERLAWIVASAATALLVVAAAFVVPPMLRKQAPPLMRFAITTPEGVTMQSEVVSSAISPDGRKLAFIAADSSGTPAIWIRTLETLTSQLLAGTENASLPFWSPDSKELGFFADGKLKKIALAGGSAEALCEALDGRGATWGRDGTILFVPVAAGSIERVPADGGEPTEVMRPDSTKHETGLRWPCFLPDGKHYTFVSLPARQGNYDVYLGTLGSKNRKHLVVAGSAPIYAAPGYLVFDRNRQPLAQRFDSMRLAVAGSAQQLRVPPPSNFNGAPLASASTTGVLAHLGLGLPNTQLVWLDRAGKPQGTIPLPAGRWGLPSFSPDGQRMVIERHASPTEVDLWMVELSRGVATRFTFTNAPQTGNAVWSPDGQWIAYNSDRGGPRDIYRKSANGGGEEELLYSSGTLFKNVDDWTRDGRAIVFEQPDPTTGWDLWLLPIEGERKPVPYIRSRFNERFSSMSPDGKWLAYQSDESGKSEVYVQSFPTPGNKYQVSTAGGFGAFWSITGKEMLVFTLDGTVQAADVQTSPNFKLGALHTLFKSRQDLLAFKPTPDATRFLETVPVGAASSASVTVEINWQAGLKK